MFERAGVGVDQRPGFGTQLWRASRRRRERARSFAIVAVERHRVAAVEVVDDLPQVLVDVLEVAVLGGPEQLEPACCATTPFVDRSYVRPVVLTVGGLTA